MQSSSCKYPRDVRLRDIPLRPPLPRALDRAIRILNEQRDKARASSKVTQVALTGEKSQDIKLHEICHACMPGMVVPPELRVGGIYQWPVRMKPKVAAPYRYMIGWSNHEIKTQYRRGRDLQEPFKGALLRDMTMYYDWLRNHSHWSRFFVGPKDPRFLRDFGYILDLQAPSFVVHFMAVAWRMPGEYHEMIVRWAHLVRNGLEPHFAFAIVQDVEGFEQPDGFIQHEQRHRGHRLISPLSINGVARITAGVVSVLEATDLASARRMYSTSCNSFYHVEGEAWIDVMAKKYNDDMHSLEATYKDIWGNVLGCRKMYSALFQSPYDEGIIDLNLRTQSVIRKRGWFTHVPRIAAPVRASA